MVMFYHSKDVQLWIFFLGKANKFLNGLHSHTHLFFLSLSGYYKLEYALIYGIRYAKVVAIKISDLDCQ